MTDPNRMMESRVRTYQYEIKELNKHIERLQNELRPSIDDDDDADYINQLRRHEHIDELIREREVLIEDLK